MRISKPAPRPGPRFSVGNKTLKGNLVKRDKHPDLKLKLGVHASAGAGKKPVDGFEGVVKGVVKFVAHALRYAAEHSDTLEGTAKGNTFKTDKP